MIVPLDALGDGISARGIAKGAVEIPLQALLTSGSITVRTAA